MTPFIILAMPRSGTQLLASLLRAHPDVIAHGEMLNYIDENIDDTTLIEICYRQLEQLNKKAVGITIVTGQFNHRPLTIPNLLAVPDMHVIVIERRDQLSRIRSLYQASHVWHWDCSTPAEDLPTVTLPPQIVHDYLRSATIFHNQMRTIPNWLAWITYEELITNQDKVMDALWAFLRIESPGPVPASTFRQEYRPLSETVANLDEIATELAGTRYEQLLPEGLLCPSFSAAETLSPAES